MQIQTGTAAVGTDPGEPQAVWASVGNDWSAVNTSNALFGVNQIWYAVQGPAYIDTNPGPKQGRWRLDLAANYTGTTNETAIYTIHKDFEPVFGFPLFAPGDTQMASLLNRIFTGLALALQGGGIVSGGAQFVGNTDIDWGTIASATIIQSPALTVNRNGTLPPAANYPLGFEINYIDYLTSNDTAFGRTWSPAGADTLNGAVDSIKPFEGNGSARFVSDGSSNWALLDQHAVILRLEDPTDPTKRAVFDLSAISHNITRTISVPDSDVTLGSGGGGGGVITAEKFTIQSAVIATPPSGEADIFVRSVAGHSAAQLINSTAAVKSLQYALYDRQFGMWTPGTPNNGQSIGASFTSYGTAGDGSGTPSTYAIYMRRKTYGSVVTTLNQQVGITQDAAAWIRQFGFFFHCRFSLDHWTAGDRLFVGLVSTTANAITTVDPSTLTNLCGFCIEAGDTAITFLHKATTSAPKDAIAGQPALAANNGYDAFIFQTSAGGVSGINWRLDDINAGTTIAEGSATTQLISTTTFLRMAAVMGNAANTASLAAQIGIAKLYCESR